jgi:serine-type D-Ala-D-Ala carboxypeptidase/endopeptidase (penicillin-binding protein 4)
VLQVGPAVRLPLIALVGLLTGTGSVGAQQSAKNDTTLQQQLDKWFSRAARAVPGQWGVAVADSRGQLLWSANATRPMVPASAAKVFTTGFARTVLGGEARKSTRVLGNGSTDEQGTWVGTWSLEVNGDPTLERPLRSGPTLRELASQLADRGIRRLVGPLTIQSATGAADAAYPSVWSPKHKGRRFAPLIGDVTLNENQVIFTIAPGSRPGVPVRVVGTAPDGMDRLVEVRAKTVKGRRNSLVFRQDGTGHFVVSGSLGIRARYRTWSGPSNKPLAVLEACWGAALTRAGIEWVQAPSIGADGATTASRMTLAEIASAPLDSIATEVNTRSLNIGAEALLRWAAGPIPNAAEQLTDHVGQVIGDPMAVHLVDGSGLSYDDRASPWAFVTYMARFPSTPAGRNFPLLLPANGSGTLRKLSNGFPGPGVVRAKTGTLSNAATLVGYLGHKDGLILISVMYNGSRVYAAKQQQWRLFRILGADGTMVPGDSMGSDMLGGDDPSEIPPAPPVPRELLQVPGSLY